MLVISSGLWILDILEAKLHFKNPFSFPLCGSMWNTEELDIPHVMCDNLNMKRASYQKTTNAHHEARKVNRPVQVWMKPNKHGTAFLNKRAESKCRLISMGRVYGW
jgi:hypothetical protein